MKTHPVFRTLVGLAVLIALAFSFSPSPQAADASTPPPNNLIFILDSSGSMWGRIEGDLPKISVAKSVMTDLISGLDAGSSVGLIAYGHRRKGDCSDVETLTPLQSLDKDRLIGQIKGINPKGKTPITRSVKEAVEILRTVEESAGIVLVSDGIETCEGDPCEAVKAAKAAGIPFTMHVVGFDVAEAETDQLRCMADAGGGRYFTARNTAQLSDALKTAVEAPPAPPQSRLQVEVRVNGELGRAEIDVYRSGDGKRISRDRTDRREEENPIAFALEPGEYDVTVRAIGLDESPEQKRTGIVVPAEETVTERFEFGSGKFQITTTVNDKLAKADVDIYEAGTNHKVAGDFTGRREKNNPATFTLQPGTYDVTVDMVDMDARLERKIEGVVIEPGKTVTEHMEFGSGTFRITATVNDKLAKADVDIYEAGTNHKVAGDFTGRREKNNPATFTLQPGTYDVTVDMVDMDARLERKIEGVVIEPGKTVTEHMEFGSGTFRITATVNDKLAKADVDIYEAGTNHKVAGDYTGRRDKNNPSIFTVEPGEYDVTVEILDMDDRPEEKLEGTAVEKGQTVQKEIRMAAGTLNVKATLDGKLGRADIDIYEAGTRNRVAGGRTRRGAEKNPLVFTLKPGAYDIAVEMRDAEDRPTESKSGVALEAAQVSEHHFEF